MRGWASNAGVLPPHGHVCGLFLRFSACGCSPSLARRSLLCEYVAESQAVGQIHERLPVLVVGPGPAFSPAPHRVAIGPQAAGNLRPRQAGLLLEPLQSLREVFGEDVGSSVVASVLSWQGVCPPSAQPVTAFYASASIPPRARFRR